MTVEVIGVDHIFVSVGDLGRSKEVYDRVMAVLGFREGEGTIGGDPPSSTTTASSPTC